jgi:hypothetical protein
MFHINLQHPLLKPQIYIHIFNKYRPGLSKNSELWAGEGVG